MPKVDIRKVLESIDRSARLTKAGWGSAVAAARESEDDGLSSQSFEPGSGGGGVSSPTERAALRRLPAGRVRPLAELERKARAAERAAADLAAEVSRLAQPRSRMVDGRPVTVCGNPYGCPEGRRARKRGLCDGCWHFEDGHGRHRTAEDVAERIVRERQAAAERKRASRANGVA